MENKLTDKELAFIFKTYMPCDAIVQFENNMPSHVDSVTYTDMDDCIFIDIKYPNDDISIPTNRLSEVKLLLTPLSCISDEHAIEVAKEKAFINGNEPNISHLIQYTKKQIKYWIELDYKIYNLCLSQGYAVPLFFGVRHWANRKTAIQLGIAIEKQSHAS